MYPQLKTGCHLFLGKDGKCWVVNEQEQAASADVPSLLIKRIQEGSKPTEADDDYSMLISALQDRGVLVTSTDNESSKPISIVVDCSSKLLDSLTTTADTLLGTFSFTKYTEEALSEVDPHLVIAFSQYTRDKYHQAIEARCRENNLPFTRVCQEGNIVSISPIALKKTNASYKDLGNRRLAASSIGNVLRELWFFLEETGKPTNHLELPLGLQSIVFGLLLSFAEGIASAKTDSLPINQEICIDIYTLSIKRHPVLPLPSGILRKTQIDT